MHDPFADRLNDYIDGELGFAERTELEAHLSTCERCAEAVKELKALVQNARSLPDAETPDALWEAIRLELPTGGAAGGSPETSRATFVYTYLYPALTVAALLIIGFSLWVFRPVGPAGSESPDALVGVVTEELRQADAHYARAIDGLEQIIVQNDGVLPEELSAVLNENLDLIEQAISESRSALATEPESVIAQESLLEALRRKVSLLQSTILLINEVRKGEGENALDLIDQIRQTPGSSNPI